MLVEGYAEMQKQKCLDQYGTDEYCQKRAENIKQDVLNNPEIYLNMPTI